MSASPHPASMRTLLRRIGAVLVVAALSSLAMANSADAEVRDAVTGVGVRTDGGPVTQSVAVEGIYPGAQHETLVFLEGRQTATVQRVALDVVNIRDLENECNRPEHNSADLSCGDGVDQGELSGFLEVSLASGVEQPVSGTRSCVLTAAPADTRLLGEATSMLVSRPTSLPDDATMCLAVTFRHVVRGTSDNLTQTDRVLFDVELRFEDDRPEGGIDPDDADVGGVSVDSPRTLVPATVVPGGGTLRLGLATTGAPLLVLLGIALGLMGTGVLVRLLARGGAA